jgi:chromosome segregation ATPase
MNIEENNNMDNDNLDEEITRNTSELINLGERIISYKPKGVRHEAIEIIQGLASKLKQNMEHSKGLEKDLGKARDDAEKFKKQNKTLEEKNKSLEGELSNKTKELNDYIGNLEKNKGSLEGNLSSIKTDLSDAMKKINSLEDENKSLHEENALQKDMIANLERKLLEELDKENTKREHAEKRFDAKVIELRTYI